VTAFPYSPAEDLLTRRYPEARREDGRLPIDVVATHLRVDRSTVVRWRKVGTVAPYSADRIACALGTHASLVWPDEWWHFLTAPSTRREVAA
jgi:hypothetical protein